jgi:hypothetical protein
MTCHASRIALVIVDQKGADMKTLLAIALAAAALTIATATVAPISSTAVAVNGKPYKSCGAAACVPRGTKPAPASQRGL